MPVAQFRADPVTVHRWTELGGTRGDQKLDQSRVEVYQEDNHSNVDIYYVEQDNEYGERIPEREL